MPSPIRMFTLSADAYLYHADCRDVLAELPADSLDSCVCDPPYHLTSVVKRFGAEGAAPAKHGTDGLYARQSAGFMGKQWDGGDIAFDPDTWRAVWRVLKPGAHLVAFGAPRGYHRMACAIEDAGFEIRDSLMWIFGTGFPKSHDVSKGIDSTLGVEREKVPPKNVIAWQRDSGNVRPYMLDPNHMTISDQPISPQAIEFDGWGTALKPAYEPIILARKPLSEKTVAANVLKWGTGAINIDACRVPSESRPHIERRNDNSMDGAVYGSGINGSRSLGTFDQGRWPANVVTDGSAEVIEAFPQTAPAKAGKRNAPKIGGTYGDYSGDDPDRMGHTDSGGSAARFFYSSKANKTDRAGSKHPTVKPVSLMEWLCKLVTPNGGVILDPFAGSGTTLQAAVQNGFKAIGVEKEPEYIADIARRMLTIPT